jgi:hypothetical protein
MRGRKKQYVVGLTGEMREEFELVVAASSTPQGIAQRAKMLLLCATRHDWSDRRVAEEVECCGRSVRKWRKRWIERKSIHNAPRSGRPWPVSP